MITDKYMMIKSRKKSEFLFTPHKYGIRAYTRGRAYTTTRLHDFKKNFLYLFTLNYRKNKKKIKKFRKRRGQILGERTWSKRWADRNDRSLT